MSVVVLEVPGDRVGASVLAFDGELGTEFEDQLDHVGRCGLGSGVWFSGARLESGVALGSVAGEEFVHP